MALNYREKLALDDMVKQMFDTFCERQTVPYSEMLQLIRLDGETLSFASIDASFSRIVRECEQYDYMYNSATHCFVFSKGEAIDYTNDTFEKEKNLLHFGCYNGLTYDFITKQFNIPLETFKNADRFFKADIINALNYEWMFNYTNNFSTILNIMYHCSKVIYSKMPNGFSEALKTSEEGLTWTLLRNYYFISKYGKYAKIAQELSYYLGIERAEKFFRKCSFENFLKLIKNDIMDGYINSSGEVCRHLNTIIACMETFEDFVLDYNRGLGQNSQNAGDILDTRKNEILSKRLQKLNFINGLKMGDYVVVVPQNQKDKQDEGRMQNNCVGSHYDRSIIEGRNYIYFLRKADNVKHSYITCRYNIEERDTVEFRKKNNASVTDRQEREIIEQISEIIRQNLS